MGGKDELVKLLRFLDAGQRRQAKHYSQPRGGGRGGAVQINPLDTSSITYRAAAGALKGEGGP